MREIKARDIYRSESPERLDELDAIRGIVEKEFPPGTKIPEDHDRDLPATGGDLFEILGLIDALKTVRESQNLSLEQLSNETGFAISELVELESGRMANPTLSMLSHYANAIGKHLRLGLAE